MSGPARPVPAPHRARWPRYLPLAVLLLLVLEIWLLVQLGHLVGTGWVLVLLLAETLLGVLVLRRAGRAALVAFRSSASVPRGTPVPGQQPGAVGDALLAGAGGALLVLPGLLSDVLGLLFVVPPTRRAVRVFGTRWITRRVERAVRRAGGVVVVDGEVVPPRTGPPAGPASGEVLEGEVLPGPSRELGDGRGRRP